MAVHGQDEEPFPDAFGYNAAAGFTTSFGIKYIRTKRLPAPYGNCTDKKDDGTAYYYDGTYTVEVWGRSPGPEGGTGTEICEFFQIF